MSGNFPTFEDVAVMDADDIRRLSPETLALLKDELDARAKALSHDSEVYSLILNVAFKNDAEAAFRRSNIY